MADIMKAENTLANASDFNIPRGYICTLDIDTIDGKIKLAEALNGAGTMKDKVGETLRVVDIVTTPGKRSRDDSDCTNTYLILEDGTCLFSQSDGIAKSVQYLVGIFTDRSTGKMMDLIDNGVGFMIKSQVLPNDNTLKTIIPVKL